MNAVGNVATLLAERLHALHLATLFVRCSYGGGVIGCFKLGTHHSNFGPFCHGTPIMDPFQNGTFGI